MSGVTYALELLHSDIHLVAYMLGQVYDRLQQPAHRIAALKLERQLAVLHYAARQRDGFGDEQNPEPVTADRRSNRPPAAT